MDLLGVRPYTDAVARQEKAKYREIEKEQDRIAELRQSIVYIQTTPPREIEKQRDACLRKLQAINREVAACPDKKMKAFVKRIRNYTAVKAQFKRMDFLFQ